MIYKGYTELLKRQKMTELYEFHSHTNYTDGRDSATEMVKAAYEKGLRCYGISEHLFCDNPAWGFMGAELDAYLDELDMLKKQYKDKMDVLIGLEVEDSEALDYITPLQLARTDYTIRSTHGIRVGEEDIGIDADGETLRRIVNQYFGGDWYGLIRSYYDMESKIDPRMDYAFIGHFDLITKFNQDDCLYRTDCDDYLEPAMEALHSLLQAEIPFEINSGAMSRGYRKEPYPSVPLLKEIKQRGGRILISSDAHRTDNICYNYDNCLKLAYDCGFRKMTILTADGSREVPLC